MFWLRFPEAQGWRATSPGGPLGNNAPKAVQGNTPQDVSQQCTSVNRVSSGPPPFFLIYLSEFNYEGSIPVTIANPNLIPKSPLLNLNISKWGLDFNTWSLEGNTVCRQAIAIMKWLWNEIKLIYVAYPPPPCNCYLCGW